MPGKQRLQLYPPLEPYRTGTLKVSEVHTLFYEEVGNPKGKPALFLHGGPGVGIVPDYRRFFDPDFYRVILPDQRGAGRSTPHADLRENTTWHLVEDLEKLRLHLGLDSWLVMGGSWGSTLALCYAIRYPQSVKAIIIRGVFLARPFEIYWLFQEGAARIYPDAWEGFIALVPKSERGDVVKAYQRLMTTGTLESQIKAAKEWSRYEAAMVKLIPDPETIEQMTDNQTGVAIGRIECQYTADRFFMPSDNFILENIGKIKDIPLRIVQGRYDIVCPMQSAWDLHKAHPKSDLRIVLDGSHSPLDEGMTHELIQASEDFKKIFTP
jgi:proline iminopeptidase